MGLRDEIQHVNPSASLSALCGLFDRNFAASANPWLLFVSVLSVLSVSSVVKSVRSGCWHEIVAKGIGLALELHWRVVQLGDAAFRMRAQRERNLGKSRSRRIIWARSELTGVT
jgi:hypothetical protein